MALVPSRQFYPTTTTTTAFLDSFQSKFHGTPLHFLKYNPSSIPLKNLTFTHYATHNYFSSNPKKPTNKNPISPHNNNTWLHNWNKPHHQNLPKAPPFAFNYRNNNSHNITSNGGGGGGGGSTMDKIVEKLKKFGYVDEGEDKKEKNPDRVIEKGSVEDIFYVEEGMLPNTRGGFSKESPLGDDKDVMFPWEKPRKVEEEEKDKWTARKKSRTSLAELTLPESELRRLKNMMFLIKNKTKVGGAGVTRKVVDAIHEKWKTSEIVRVKVEGDPALNMKRMHEILERKTGGLVIWRSGTSVTLYRGVSYEVPSVQLNKRIFKRNEISPYPLPTATDKTIRDPLKFSSYNNVDAPLANPETTTEAEAKRDRERMSVVNYEEEVDQLLDCLGPRYTDWSGLDPLPVDADMLPGIVPGYQPPLRVLPYGVRSTIGQKEATALRRLARILPPHFALGRSRQLQGLAVAMIKLWERSSIAKIALKRGVQLTTSERMAEELKKLTGGMLLSRNKDFLVFYRGKNFLSPDVTEALQERERLAKSLQDEEEQARLRASAFFVPSVEIPKQAGTAGTLGETLDADARWGKRLDDHQKEEMMREAEVVRHANLFRKLERKLAFAERKLMKAERALSKVEEFLKPTEQQADPESITDEERFMFRKLGLRMKAFLLLGRRGVFDGTVENMHLHWKYRELIKILVKAKSFEQVKKVALALEAESGGVLVSVDKVSKGYAIIVYRGKDYQRPSKLRPKNLLTKRKALARSIELQRREALLNHISAVQTKVDKLRAEIEQMDIVKDRGDEELYDKLDSAYPTDDEDAEEEGDEAYLETYDGENDGKDESDDLIHNFHLETNFPYHDQHQSEIESVRNKLDSAHPTDDEDTEEEGDGVYLETYDSENDGEGENHDSIHNFHLETNFTYHDKHQSETES